MNALLQGQITTNGMGNVSASKHRTVEEDSYESFVNWLSDVLDEDDMASNSASKVPTQQSVKAYVDGLNHYRGLYTSLANLQSAIPTGNAGDFADVDPGSGTDLTRYAWDADEGWVPVASGGGVSGLTTTRVPFATSSTTLGDDATLTWDNTNKMLTVDEANIFTGESLYPNNDNLWIGATFPSSLGGSATDNVFVGVQAGDAITSGGSNVGVGAFALTGVTSGPGNIGVGFGAGSDITTGEQNIVVGSSAGNVTTGDENIVIGYGIHVQSSTADGQLTIQNAIFGTGNTRVGPTDVAAGNIGFYVTSPTARVHLPAHTTAANSAPLKFTSGTAMTTPEDGAIEYHSSHLYFTIGSTRYQLDQQGGGLGDGDYGDIVVSGSGTAINLDSTITKTATTGTGVAFTSSTLTSGTLVSFSATGTAAASNTKTVVSVTSSGANATSSQTVTAFSSIITNTGTGADNVAGYFQASGGSTNSALLLKAGGTTSDKVLRIQNSSASEILYVNDYGQVVSVNNNTTNSNAGFYTQATVTGVYRGFQCNSNGANAQGGFFARNNGGYEMSYFITGGSFATIPNYGLLRGGSSLGGIAIIPAAAGVVISNSDAALTTNAILDLQSTTKAFIPPRMTTTQRDAIGTPSAGMVIYNTTTGVLNFYNGSAWGAV